MNIMLSESYLIRGAVIFRYTSLSTRRYSPSWPFIRIGERVRVDVLVQSKGLYKIYNLNTMYINRGNLLKFILQAKKFFEFLNKHFYLVLILSTISKYLNTRFYKFISWLVKVFVLASIIFSISYILYFSIAEHSFNYGLSFYNDFISHIQSKIITLWYDLVNLWNDLINIDDNVIKHVSNNKDMNLNIKNQVKDGIKEAIGEILDELHAEVDNSNTNLYKNIALISSGLFLGYLIFILPGSNVTPVELTNYNWVLKHSIIN